MSRCLICGQSGDTSICEYHVSTDASWGSVNRLMCDFVHRAIVPPRLAVEDRIDVDDLVEVEGTGLVTVP